MPASRQMVFAPDAPAAIGPYVHAVRAEGLLFCSGQIPLDPASGEIVGSTPGEQARQCLKNLESVCAAAGARLQDAVKVSVLLIDMGAFAEVNDVYATFFDDEPPARVAYAVAALPRGAQVEIDAVVAVAD